MNERLCADFVEYLTNHRENRGVMASLRRGLGKRDGDMAMYPYVVPWIPEKANAWVLFTVASLFGFHHDPLEKGVSMGKALGRLERNESLQKRFAWLLDSQPEELPSRLKSVVSLLKRKNVGLDYVQLCKDLNHWDHPRRFVQFRWAKDFYTETPQQEKE